MKISDVYNGLLPLVKDGLISHGFKLKKQERTFFRSNNGINQKIVFLFDKSYDSVVIDIMLYVKSDQITSFFEKNGRFDSAILNFHLGINLLDTKCFFDRGSNDYNHCNQELRIVISDEVDIQEAGVLLNNYFDKYMYKYFSIADSVEGIDKLLNGNPKELSIHHYLYPTRAIVGLIAAKLSDNPDLKTLEGIYDAETLEAEEGYRECFTLVRNLLNDMEDVHS